MRRILLLMSIAASAAVAGILISSAAAVPNGSRSTIATFSDSVGEVAGGPDISTVTVSLEGDVLTVMGQVASMPELTTPGAVMFLLNTDSNSTTGGMQGADFVIVFDTETIDSAVLQWNGSDYVDAAKVADPSRMVIGSGQAGFMFNLANFGSPKHVEFAMAVVKGAGDGSLIDLAPDSGLWPFDAVAPPPPPTTTTTTTTTTTPPPVALKPVIGAPAATPARPASGKRMTVTFPVLRSDNRKPLLRGVMVCDPSVAGKVIKHAESFKAGKARLSFVVPNTAKGKVLKVKVTIKVGSKAATRVATYRVR